MPEESVETVSEVPDVEAFVIVAPAVVVKVTTVAETGLPDASVTRTDGGTATAAFTGAVCPLPAFSARFAAEPWKTAIGLNGSVG